MDLDHIAARIGDEILARINHPLAEKPRFGVSSSVLPPPAESGPPPALPGQPSAGCGCIHAPSGGFDRSIAAMIDHTLLKPEATPDDIRRLCSEARRYAFAAVCVNPYWVALAAAELAGSPVKVCSVAGFPLGAATTAGKCFETEAALRAGAAEIDMVIQIGALRAGDFDAVRNDIRAVVELAHGAGAIVKTILETALLDDNQKAVACTLAKLAGADFVKTSTGFGPGGASAADVALMRSVVGPQTGVKAAGGIRTLQDLRQMVAAGANRVGASASVKIIEATAA